MRNSPRSLRALVARALTFLGVIAAGGTTQAATGPLNSVLESIRAKYDLPGLGAATFTTDGLVEVGAVGVRKRGADVPVTTNDLWHLGSDTKMMTAALAGTFVAEKKLAWDDKVATFFPKIAKDIPEAMRYVTIGQVMNHQAGLTENLNWRMLSQGGFLRDQRLAAVRLALSKPAFALGEYHYANTDYVVIGAVLERIGGKPWEDLIRERLFEPLGMKTVGFGGTGTVGQIDQPWPHLKTGAPATSNGPAMDNPAVMAPAGAVHCTMTDWAKFLTDQLRGGAGLPALLPREIYEAMQTPGPNSQYGFGWIVVSRPWAGGKALTHSGSNTMNYCVCWLAPAKKFGVLVCCNEAGDNVAKACDEAASMLILRHRATASQWEPQK
ncbi:N/A [soil metagenome]